MMNRYSPSIAALHNQGFGGHWGASVKRKTREEGLLSFPTYRASRWRKKTCLSAPNNACYEGYLVYRLSVDF